MKQSRLSSFIESWANVAIGLGVSLTMNALIFPRFGFNVTAKQNLALGVIYTVVSVTRSYCVRRWFNAWLHRKLTGLSTTGEKYSVEKLH